MRGERIKIPLKAGHQWPASEWRTDDGPTLNARLVALWFFRGSGPVLEPYILWFFRGLGPDQLSPPPLDLWVEWTHVGSPKISLALRVKFSHTHYCNDCHYIMLLYLLTTCGLSISVARPVSHPLDGHRVLVLGQISTFFQNMIMLHIKLKEWRVEHHAGKCSALTLWTPGVVKRSNYFFAESDLVAYQIKKQYMQTKHFTLHPWPWVGLKDQILNVCRWVYFYWTKYVDTKTKCVLHNWQALVMIWIKVDLRVGKIGFIHLSRFINEHFTKKIFSNKGTNIIE